MDNKPNLFTSIMFTIVGVVIALWAFGLIAMIGTIAGFVFVIVMVKQALHKFFNVAR
ncbi:hypothetical protein [Marinicellulosiphila megalodicopiae]|uniref:hypothetical protein n=1 Tax=Marinicellulosiphila megalodicopiae TaxID=2724896 RepID=UPI003BAE2C2B